MELPSNSRVLFDIPLNNNDLKIIGNKFTFLLDTKQIAHLYGVYTDNNGYINRGSTSKYSFDYRDDLPIVLLSDYLPKSKDNL